MKTWHWILIGGLAVAAWWAWRQRAAAAAAATSTEQNFFGTLADPNVPILNDALQEVSGLLKETQGKLDAATKVTP